MKNALACENCGSTENLENHHVQYVPVEIYKTLCLKCHHKEHKKLDAPNAPDGFYGKRRDWSKPRLQKAFRIPLNKTLGLDWQPGDQLMIEVYDSKRIIIINLEKALLPLDERLLTFDERLSMK